MSCPPYTQVKRWTYVEADTGAVLEMFETLQHFEWDPRAANGPGYVMAREYVIDDAKSNSASGPEGRTRAERA